jgi:hypothetical protein
MARNRVIPNLLYGTLGLAAVGTATYFALRSLRARREAHGEESPMLSLRRSTRNVGRAAKDSAQKVGKDIKRGVADTGEALAEAGDEFQSAQATSFNRI